MWPEGQLEASKKMHGKGTSNAQTDFATELALRIIKTLHYIIIYGIFYNVIILVSVLVSQFPEVANEKRSIYHTEDDLLQFLQILC